MTNNQIKFKKMHGLGNDFVIVCYKDLTKDAILNINDFAIKISDRRFGVGCDQFIIIKDHEGQFEMMIYNQDGSLAEACGNAARCVTKMMHDDHQIDNFFLKVGKRDLHCTSLVNKHPSVNMGKASFSEKWMPNRENLGEVSKLYGFPDWELICVDVGNPHLVIFGKNVSDIDKVTIGSILEKYHLFPAGVNVNFAEICDKNNIKLQVWERGTGLTDACGSGACATFAAAYSFGFTGNNVNVHFKHGSLNLSINSEDEINLSGPVAESFFGFYLYG